VFRFLRCFPQLQAIGLRATPWQVSVPAAHSAPAVGPGSLANDLRPRSRAQSRAQSSRPHSGHPQPQPQSQFTQSQSLSQSHSLRPQSSHHYSSYDRGSAPNTARVLTGGSGSYDTTARYNAAAHGQSADAAAPGHAVLAGGYTVPVPTPTGASSFSGGGGASRPSRPATARVSVVPRRAASPRAALASRNFAFDKSAAQAAQAAQAFAAAATGHSARGSPRGGAGRAGGGAASEEVQEPDPVYGPQYVLRVRPV